MIHITCSRGVAAELIVDPLSAQSLEQAAIAPGIDVGVATSGCAGNNVRNAVTIGVTGSFNAGAELIVGMAIGRPKQLAGLGRVNIDASRVFAAGSAGGSR